MQRLTDVPKPDGRSTWQNKKRAFLVNARFLLKKEEKNESIVMALFSI